MKIVVLFALIAVGLLSLLGIGIALVVIPDVKEDQPNAVGTIVSAIGCKSDCTENPVTSIQNCQNKGTVQVRYQMDNDSQWIEADIPAPIVCSAQPCCSMFISYNITLFFAVGDTIEIYDTPHPDSGSSLAIGIFLIVFSVVFMAIFIVVALEGRNKSTVYRKV